MSLFNVIKSHVSILDVVGEYVRLRRAGSYWKGPCPFHSETDASFTISPEKGIFYCFGCHAGGDVIAFLSKVENLSPYEAAQHVIDRYKIVVPPEVLTQTKQSITSSTAEKNSYFALCEAMAAWTHEALSRVAIARDYVAERGISQEMVKRFKIGYLPGGMRAIEAFIKAMSARGVLIKDLVEVGVLMERNGVYFSPFEERILFPITDALGRTCGFGGRVFRTGDDRAKYYNSKDLPYFSKGKLLFGLALAKKKIHDEQCAFLVEGYTDCVAMAQHGYENTVATLGTACTIDHLRLLSRHLKTLYVLYDGDSAGRKAILRLAEFCWEVNIELQIIALPPKEDPASFLGKGGNLEELRAKACDIFSFFITSLSGDGNVRTISDKYEVSTRLVEVIVRVQDGFKRDLLLQQAANSLQVPLDSLRELARTVRVNTSVNGEEEEAVGSQFTQVPTLDKKVLIAIINSIESAVPLSVPEDLFPYLCQEVQQILTSVRQMSESIPAGQRFAKLTETLSASQQAWVRAETLRGENERFEQYIDMLRRQKWKQLVQDMKQSLKAAEQEQDEEKLQTLMRGFLALHQTMKDKGLL